ncbi:MAG: hypothetical protein ACYCRH_00120 [Acidiferrobacteraceae bacterium]
MEDDRLPFAAVTHAVDAGGVDDAAWLRVDPVHLALGPQQAFLTDPATLLLTEAEACDLGALLMPVFNPYGYTLEILHPARWYVRLGAPDLIRTTPLHQALGYDVGPIMPTGAQRNLWHRLLTEAQMVLHEAPVNQRRETEDRPVVNSLWPWGEGRISRTPGIWSSVCADDILIRGLAQATGCALQPSPASVADVLAADPGGRHLMALSGPVDPGDFDEQWLTPLCSALRSSDLPALALVDGSAMLTITAREARRWWRLGRFHGRD